MARAVVVLFFIVVVGGGWSLSHAGVWGESPDMRSMRAGSAGARYYGAGGVK